MRYRDALDCQRAAHARVMEARARRTPSAEQARSGDAGSASVDEPVGELLLVEHDPPVVTLGRRSTSRDHLVVSPERLAALGIDLEESDRGGDITWHGPGQLVAYPILDLDRLGLRIHPYMRLLEQVVIDLLADFAVHGDRDPEATGVWVEHRKICAMGVRVSRWISMHGLALNVDPDLRSFELIVPCGLHGRPVTSLRREFEARDGGMSGVPSMAQVKTALVATFERHLAACIRRTSGDTAATGDGLTPRADSTPA